MLLSFVVKIRIGFDVFFLILTQQKKWVMAGSPKSILSGIGSWSLSSNGSSNSETSPPTTPFGAKSDPCDLILPAGGPVLRLKMNNEENRSCNYQVRGLLGPAWNQNPDTAGKNQNNGFSSSKSFGQDVSQWNQVKWLILCLATEKEDNNGSER